jgi:hypothetical protein
MSRITPVSAKAIQRPTFPHVRRGHETLLRPAVDAGLESRETLVQAERFVLVTIEPSLSHAISRVVDERLS